MQQIFEEGPTGQPGDIDQQPHRRMRRRRAVKGKQRGQDHERRKNQEFGKIAKLAHLHATTSEAESPTASRRLRVHRPE
jgi:hypothetical protein